MRFITVVAQYAVGPLLICFHLCAFTQTGIPLTNLTGKYDLEGGAGSIQFTVKNNELFLITAGNPVQKMERTGPNSYRSAVMKQDIFTFSHGNADTIELTVNGFQGNIKGRKVSGEAQDYSSAMDTLLTKRKSSGHFEFWYSERDAQFIDSLASHLEKRYDSVLQDFKLNSLPMIKVKIYPDLKSFHLSINHPDAPGQVLATAFGKDEFRMVSPAQGGDELMQFISHEFVHCVHLNIDYSPNNPRWLWEGVAMYESGWFMDPRQIDAIKNRQFPSLQTMGNGLEYMLGYVIIEAIEELWEFDAVLGLVKNRGDVAKVLNLENDEFEKKVFDHIYSKYISSSEIHD